MAAGCGTPESLPPLDPIPPGHEPSPVVFRGDRVTWGAKDRSQARVQLNVPGERAGVIAFPPVSTPPDTAGVVPILAWPLGSGDSLAMTVTLTDEAGNETTAFQGMVALAGHTAPPPVEEDLRVTMIDVGWGDAHLIETPAGNRILLDAGGADNQWLLRRFLEDALEAPTPDGNDIDHVFVTHLHADHYAGLDRTLLKPFGAPGYEIGAVYFSVPYVAAQYAGTYQWLADRAREGGADVVTPETGDLLDLAPDLEAMVLNAGNPFDAATEAGANENNSSFVLRFTYGEIQLVFTGDAEAPLESELLRRFPDALDAVVLKVGHHGSRDATSPAWAGAVNPDVALISIDAAQVEFALPSGDVIDRLRDQGAMVFRSDSIVPGAADRRDLTGNVMLVTDGRSITIRTDPTARPLSAPLDYTTPHDC